MNKDSIAVLAVLAMLLTVPVVGAALSERGADLAIQEQSYFDGDVTRESADSSPLYQVQGSSIDIQPQNFNSTQIVDYGVEETGDGALSYNSEFDHFVLHAPKDGTYKLYWAVREQVQVERNNTTSTEIAQVRYTARVRVSDTNYTHMPASEIESMQDDSESWDNLLSALKERGLLEEEGRTEAVINDMVQKYYLVKKPFAALGGGATAILIMMVTTLGGFLIFAGFTGWHTVALRAIQKRLNLYQEVEADEGELSARIEDIDERERRSVLQNLDWNDIFTNDNVAAAFRETFGENVHDGWESFVTAVSPRLLVKDRLEVMRQNGWQVVVSRDGDTIVDAELVHEPDEDVSSEPLDTDNEDLLDALNWDANEIKHFRLSDADFDPDSLDSVPVTLDLESVIGELGSDMQHLDESVYGQYLREFVGHVREHPFSGSDGTPDTTREVMENFLKTAQLLDDRYQFPVAAYFEDAIERAVVDYDPAESAQRTVNDVQKGKVSQSDD